MLLSRSRSTRSRTTMPGMPCSCTHFCDLLDPDQSSHDFVLQAPCYLRVLLISSKALLPLFVLHCSQKLACAVVTDQLCLQHPVSEGHRLLFSPLMETQQPVRVASTSISSAAVCAFTSACDCSGWVKILQKCGTTDLQQHLLDRGTWAWRARSA